MSYTESQYQHQGYNGATEEDLDGEMASYDHYDVSYGQAYNMTDQQNAALAFNSKYSYQQDDASIYYGPANQNDSLTFNKTQEAPLIFTGKFTAKKCFIFRYRSSLLQ